MFAKAANSTPAVPSRNALRVLRQLAFAGSVGTFCTVAAITYDVHRRIRVAEQIIENKRMIRTSAPNYDATSSAKRLALMMDAAESGEFMGLDSLKHRSNQSEGPTLDVDRSALAQDMGLPPPTHRPTHTLRPTLAVRPTSLPALAAQYQDPATSHENQIAVARELQADEARRAEGLPTFEEVVRTMLVERRAVEAANLFLTFNRVNGDNVISWGRRALGVAVYTANCLQGNVFIARSMFVRLEKVSVVDTNLWTTMIHMLAKEGHVESAATVFDRYRNKFDVPPYLLEITIRCLIESNRLSAARWLFYQNIEHDIKGGLCGAYLDGLWRKTHSVELITKEFRRILADLAELERNPTEKVFNALVKALIDAGQFEDAEALVCDMEAKHAAKPGCRTLGLILYGKALQCDWDGVLAGMREMHELGFTTTEKRTFCQLFDRLWLEFWPSHSGPECWSFLETCIIEFDISPDKILHRHCLEGLIEKCDPEILTKFSLMGEERRWNSGMNYQSTMNTIKARRLAMRESPVGVWKMLQSAKKQHGMVTMTRRIMGKGAEYYNIDRDKIAPITHQAYEAEREIGTTLNRYSSNLYVPITKRMEHYVHTGKFLEAKELFDQAVHNGYLIKSQLVRLVVIAMILHDGLGGLVPAKEIIKKYWTKETHQKSFRVTERVPRFAPIFFQQLMQLHQSKVTESTLLKICLFEFYELCAEKARFTVKHHSSVSVARRMIALRRPLTAVNVLSAIYMSKWRKSHGFDQIQLKMLIRAHTYLKNARGVWWCIMTVLTRGDQINRDFVVEVERLTTLWESTFSPPVMETLRGLISVLRQKHDGIEYWNNFVADAKRKKQNRAQITTPPVNCREPPLSTTIEEALVGFDEEVEFDRLINRTQLTKKSLRYWWDEDVMVYCTTRQPEHPQYPVSPAEDMSSPGEPKPSRDFSSSHGDIASA
ncbi:hypothetical protein N7466_000885 [Penicillium verhagenii]|uniref:uncharacterized protein n=1 Tax=Penicillium verhagenii TaxID=1562060 RepID=UPI002545089D|nr:uncharacterized protein N7466_000885 [Penicillium verhagenii]KAJ5947870.1 hypothetical protein N7466_000885 [Penicillium verhagenii]